MILDTIFSWPLYLGALSWCFMLFVWPFVVWLLVFILKRKLTLPDAKKKQVILLVALTVYIAPVFDALLLSIRFNWLCNSQAGMYVYRTVDGVEGFLTDSKTLAEIFIERGVRYAEYQDRYGGKFRVTLSDKGEAEESSVDEFWSFYQHDHQRIVLNDAMVKQWDIVKDRQTGELLGELSNFALLGGLMDRTIMGWMGSHAISCQTGGKRMYSRHLIPEVLKFIDK